LTPAAPVQNTPKKKNPLFFPPQLPFLSFRRRRRPGHDYPQPMPDRQLTSGQCPRPSVLARSEFRLDVCDRPVECDKLRIIELGYLDAEAMVDGGNEVQEVHRIDVESLAQIRGRIDARHINFRCDIVELFLHHLANVDVIHSLSGSCSSLPLSARNNAPACPSLTRWSAESVMVITERGPMAPSITHGRVTILPKPTIATCGG